MCFRAVSGVQLAGDGKTLFSVSHGRLTCTHTHSHVVTQMLYLTDKTLKAHLLKDRTLLRSFQISSLVSDGGGLSGVDMSRYMCMCVCLYSRCLVCVYCLIVRQCLLDPGTTMCESHVCVCTCAEHLNQPNLIFMKNCTNSAVFTLG